MVAVFTPRGLKLRLPTLYTFALIARQHPRVDAFRVLQTTEVVEHLRGLATFLSGAAAFSLRLEPLQIGVLVFVAVSIMHIVHLVGLFVPPITFLLPISRVYGFVSGYGVLLIGVLIFGLFSSGWAEVMAFIVGRVACGAVFGIVELQHSKRIHQRIGIFVSRSARSFFHACRLEANRLGASTDLTVADSELVPTNWEPVLDDLASKWPEVVGRFTVD
jgi:hypothetical protein